MARRGHYCWSCGRMRANEKFSGQNHARHLCKECARLGKKELADRQAIRNLERLLGASGFITRRNRVRFRQYLTHEDERVRAYACEIETADAWAAAELRLRCDLDEVLAELAAEECIGIGTLGTEFLPEDDDKGDEEIPSSTALYRF